MKQKLLYFTAGFGLALFVVFAMAPSSSSLWLLHQKQLRPTPGAAKLKLPDCGADIFSNELGTLCFESATGRVYLRGVLEAVP